MILCLKRGLFRIIVAIILEKREKVLENIFEILI